MAIPQGQFYETLGNRIRQARRAANLTQEQLASSVGISRTSLTNMEKGRQPIYMHILAKIGETLGVSLENFMGTSEVLNVPLKGSVNKRIQKLGLNEEMRSWVEKVISHPASTATQKEDT